MSKLYVFGIGGTGSRVLKSLVMLLAAGVKCEDTIVPIIIDRDIANADLTRTKKLIDSYIEISSKVPKPNKTNTNRFFSTSVNLLNSSLFLQLKDNTQIFSDFIGYNTMSEANKALVSMLYANNTLDLNMNEGFQGNPNLGSVVLNQFDDADIFKEFARSFQDGDKIFIISSIFGGTGASGFPLLLKNLKSDKPNMANWGLVQNAPIGAITVMPYFDVSNQKSDKNKDSLVNSETFIDKTKAALSYYQSFNEQLSSLYYIADNERSSYEHNKGGQDQKNNAHFVELASALSVLDFSNEYSHVNSNLNETIYKEFGIVPGKRTSSNGEVSINNCKVISFSDLADETNDIIKHPMIQLYLFKKYLTEVFDKEKKYQPYARDLFGKKSHINDFLVKLKDIQNEYYFWLKEMGEQNRSFIPFKLKEDNKATFEFISDLKVTDKQMFFYKNWAWMDNELNKTVSEVSKSLTAEAQVVELFYRVTNTFINKFVKN